MMRHRAALRLLALPRTLREDDKKGFAMQVYHEGKSWWWEFDDVVRAEVVEAVGRCPAPCVLDVDVPQIHVRRAA